MQIFQSASLCLTTTTPEQLASALWWFMIPLKVIGVPVPEIILTLLLSLRFINLVFDEASIGYFLLIIHLHCYLRPNLKYNIAQILYQVRNSALAIVTRRIDWKRLATMESIESKYCCISNLAARVESIALHIMWENLELNFPFFLHHLQFFSTMSSEFSKIYFITRSKYPRSVHFQIFTLADKLQ